MLSRTLDVSRRIASSRPELCYRALRTVTTTAATPEGSTGGRRVVRQSTPPSQMTAFVTLKDNPRSLAEAFFILGTLERKYGAIVDTELFPDPDLADRYRNAMYIIFKDKESLRRIPMQGERLFVSPPDQPTNPLDIRLTDLEANYQRGDYDPLFKVPTKPFGDSAHERIIELEVKHADYDKTFLSRGHSNPIPPKQILRAFGEWGGFSQVEPAENSGRIVMKQLFSNEPTMDNIHLRFALQSYKENIPGSAMVSQGKESDQRSSSSSMPFDMNSVLWGERPASKPSRATPEAAIPLKDLSPSPSATPAKEELDVHSMIDAFSSNSKSSKRAKIPTLSPEETAAQQAALDRQIEMAKQLLRPKISQASKQPKQNKPKVKILKRADLVEESTEIDDIQRLIEETKEQSLREQAEKKGVMGAIWGLFNRK